MLEPKQIRSTSGLNGVVKVLLELAIEDCKKKDVKSMQKTTQSLIASSVES